MKRWLMVVLVVAAGCDPLSPRTDVVKTRYYSISPTVEVQTGTSTAASIGLRPLEYARVYKQPIVYREATHEVKLYEYDEWTELPRDIVTRAIQDALTKTQRFADVGDAIVMRAPDYTLTGELRAFEEVRNDGNPRARVEVRLSLRQSLHGDGNSAVWSDILSAEVPLPQDNVAGVAEAMSEAVAQIAEAAATAIAALDLKHAER
jgi:ABC-type uncharacterized transport system auxiliary subunit